MSGIAWRPIPGWPGYEVSASGRVRRIDTRYEIARTGNRVQLSRNGRPRRFQVADLVAMAFPKDDGLYPPETIARVEQAKAEGEKNGFLQPCEAPRPDLLDTVITCRACGSYDASRPWAEEDLCRTCAELLALAAEYDCLSEGCDNLIEENTGLHKDNADLMEEIGEKNAALAQASQVLTINDKDTEIVRLRGLVAELEAELAIYRGSDGL
jgi:hypothetical protein